MLASSDGVGVGRVRFSRMSGIQQFRNAVVLFVNVGGIDYQNVFQEEDKIHMVGDVRAQLG